MLDETNEQQNGSDVSKSAVERLVMLRCECGTNFEREQKYVDSYEEYKDEYPVAARFFKRKITFCNSCYKQKMNESLKALPKILEALAT